LMLRGSSTDGQVLGMAASRVALFLGIFLPVNVFIVVKTTGLPVSRILKSLKSPLAAGLAAIGAVLALEHLGALSAIGDATRAARLERLALAGAVAVIAAGVTLLVVDSGLRARAAAALGRLRHAWASPPPETGAIVSDA
jgi:hypothetical protein